MRNFSFALVAAALSSHAALAAGPDLPVAIYDAPRMVFFGFGKADVSDKAREVIGLSKQIAGDYPAKIELVTGYCDSAEIAQGGCEALAVQRARAVKAELVQLGMRAEMIEVRSSTEMLVPTGPNVREPQNRHVVIEPN